MSEAVIDPGVHADGNDRPASDGPNTSWALAGMSGAAGVIHFAMTPIHAANGWQEPLLFAAAGWFQLITAGLALMGRAGRRTLQLIVAANVVFIGAWAWSRTAGLPFGENPGVSESAGAIDTVTVILEVGVVLVALRMLLAPAGRSLGRVAPAMVAVAALGLATVVIVSPDAANHSHNATPELTGIAAANAKIDKTRCDRSFNIGAYWEEADYLGIDTRFANNPPAVEGAAPSGDGHAHGGSSSASASSGSTTTTDPDPLEGRGSPGLDSLVSATGLAATSEVDAAILVTKLSDASEADFDAWLWWLRSSGSLDHTHSTTFTEEDGSGHGGHVGPQPWEAVTSKKQCAQIQTELDEAQAAAMRYPTAADAKADGYVFVTGYLPGIAAHWIKYDLIDGEFEIDKPEMLLFDGNTEDASIVGLSYYLWHAGDNKPTQGFTGDNDHAHRHIGLCSSSTGVVIGDSTTTEEECEARGGSKGDGSKGWMSHAWVVPGCESPWGVFSAANPVIDDDLRATSGKDGGFCAGSGVRDRYDMGEAPTAAEVEKAAKAEKSSSSTTSADKPDDTAGG